MQDFGGFQDFNFLKSWIQVFGTFQGFGFPKCWVQDFGRFQDLTFQNPEWKILADFKI